MAEYVSRTFEVPKELDDLINVTGLLEPDIVAEELHHFDDTSCKRVFLEPYLFNIMAFAANHSKDNELLAELVSPALEQLCAVTEKALRAFFQTRMEDQLNLYAIQMYKQTTCLVLLFLKRTLKTLKSTVVEKEEGKRTKARLTDPFFLKQFALFGFLAQLIDTFGGRAEMDQSDLNVHLLDVTIMFVSFGLIADLKVNDQIGRVIHNLLFHGLCKSQEFNAQLLSALEEGHDQTGTFFGRLVAKFALEGRGNLPEIAHVTNIRVVEILMSKNLGDAPIFKSIKCYLMELIDRDPLYFYNNFGMFLILFGCENFSIRNCVCEGALRCSVFLRDRIDTDPMAKHKIIKFFEIVCGRVHDKSSFSRSATLGVIANFISLGLLDDTAYNEVFLIAIERLRDVSSLVRRRAIVLLQEICLFVKNGLPSREQVAQEIERFERARPPVPDSPVAIVEEVLAEPDGEDKPELGQERSNSTKRTATAKNKTSSVGKQKASAVSKQKTSTASKQKTSLTGKTSTQHKSKREKNFITPAVRKRFLIGEHPSDEEEEDNEEGDSSDDSVEFADYDEEGEEEGEKKERTKGKKEGKKKQARKKKKSKVEKENVEDDEEDDDEEDKDKEEEDEEEDEEKENEEEDEDLEDEFDEEGNPKPKKNKKRKVKQGLDSSVISEYGAFSAYEKWHDNTSPDQQREAAGDGAMASQSFIQGNETIEEKLFRKNKFYEGIYTHIESALPTSRMLIFSRNSSDIVESLRLVYVWTLMDIPSARSLLLDSLRLVWSKDKAIREEVMLVFHRVFVDETSNETLVASLVEAQRDCGEDTLLCIEQLLRLLIGRDFDERVSGIVLHTLKIRFTIRKTIWNMFRESYNDRALYLTNALRIRVLRVCLEFRPMWLMEQTTELFEVLDDLAEQPRMDFNMLNELVEMLSIAPTHNDLFTDVIIKSMLSVVMKFQGTTDPYFLAFQERSIRLMFHFNKNPEKLGDYILKRLGSFLAEEEFEPPVYSQPLFGDTDQFFYIPFLEKVKEEERFLHDEDEELDPEELDANKLIHLISAAGNIAVTFLLYVESLEDNLQEKQQKARVVTTEDDVDKAEAGVETESEVKFSVLASIICNGLFEDSILESFVPLLIDYIRKEVDDEKLYADDSPYKSDDSVEIYREYTVSKNDGSDLDGELVELDSLGHLEGLIFRHSKSNISLADLKGVKARLRNSKILQGGYQLVNPLIMVCLDCLCKFMMVSPMICNRYIKFLFKLLNSSKVIVAYATNIVVYLGDLVHKHPNILSPVLATLFSCLKSRNSELRRTAITVLSHLILNDLIKIKSEIVDFVFLLEDKDPRVVQLGNLFFKKLNEKDNNFIYNMLPETISELSMPEGQGGVSEVRFEKFAKYFFKFITRERVIDHLADKFFERLTLDIPPQEVRNLVFCLTIMTANDRGIARLTEQAQPLRAVLRVRDCAHVVKTFIDRMKKNLKINKSAVEDFERIVTQNSEEVFKELKKQKTGQRAKQRRKNKQPEPANPEPSD